MYDTPELGVGAVLFVAMTAVKGAGQPVMLSHRVHDVTLAPQDVDSGAEA